MNEEFNSISKLLSRIGAEVVNEAKEIAPYDTGNLKKDIQVFDEHIGKNEVLVGNTLLTKYARYVHYGTGLYGKHKKRIVPKKKKALKTPYGVFKSTKGQKAQPYLTDGLFNYVKSGGFNRAIDECGDDMSEEIFEGLKSSLKNISIG